MSIMTARCLFLATCLAIGATAPRAADAGSKTFSPGVQRAIVNAATHELAAYGGRQPIPAVLIGVWTPDRGSFVKAIGYSHLSTRKPLSLDDKVRIGSNTKTFVITVLLQLVDEKRLGLDDPLSKFQLGVKVPNATHITVRQLCEMRSGLFEAYNTPQFDKMKITPTTKINPRTLVQWAAARPPLFAPGSRYNYSNTNYLLLGLIIESITHDSIQSQVKRRLLVPMGLRNTSFPDDPGMSAPYAHGYGLDRNKNWQDVTVNIPPSLTWAAGAMISDVADMKRWVKSYVLGTMNSKATQKARLACVPTGKKGLSFGLGIGCSAGWFGYTGGLPGYNTGAYYLPTKGATIIAFVMSQQETPHPGVANSIVRDIARVVFPANVLFP